MADRIARAARWRAMGPIAILRPGRYTSADGTPVEFSEADLRQAAEAYDPSLHEAPIVVGHPEHDAPAWGWVRALRYDGLLWALPWQVDPAFAELVRAGRYRKVSASLYRPDSPANPKPGVWYLRHVGFLGAQPPAVKGLPQVQLQDAEGVVVLREVDLPKDAVRRLLAWLGISGEPRLQEEDWRIGGDPDLELVDDDSWDGDAARDAMVRLAGGDPQSDDFDWEVLRRGHVVYNAAEPRLLGSYKFPFAKVVNGELRASRRGLVAVLQRAPQADLPARLRDRIAAFARRYLEEVEMAEKEIAALEQERDALRKQVAELQQALERAQAEQRKRAAAELADALVREGRVLPAERDAVVELLCLAEASSVKLGEGEQAQPLRAWLEAWLKQLPQRVPTGKSQAGQEPKARGGFRFLVPPGYEVDREKLALLEEAHELARARSIDLSEALKIVSQR